MNFDSRFRAKTDKSLCKLGLIAYALVIKKPELSSGFENSCSIIRLSRQSFRLSLLEVLPYVLFDQ